MIGYGVSPSTSASGSFLSSTSANVSRATISMGNSGNITFYTGSGGAIPVGSTVPMTMAMTILNNGSVGIGTASPTQALEVKGNVALSGVGDRTISVLPGNSNNLTIASGDSGGGNSGGGNLNLNGGLGTGIGNGGNVNISGGTGGINGASGSVTITNGTPTLYSAYGNVTLSTRDSATCCTSPGTVYITAGNAGGNQGLTGGPISMSLGYGNKIVRCWREWRGTICRRRCGRQWHD